MSEKQKFYNVSDYGNRVEPGDKLKLEMSIYPKRDVIEIAPLTKLPLEELQKMREESAAAEQGIFSNLRESARSWEEQAAQTLLLDMAIEYVKVPEIQHTSNQWEKDEHGKHGISNMVYQMDYRISAHTKYDKEAEKSVPYAWSVSWGVRTNSPDRRNNSKIAGQTQKRYGSMEDLQKYISGRVKAYSHLFTEVSPPIPQEYAKHFKVNGQLLPGYTVAGEERAQPQSTVTKTEPKAEALPTKDPTHAPTDTTPAVAVAAAPFVLTADNALGRLQEITDKLENGVKGIFESEQYKSFLTTVSKFHNYSFNNCILIAMQNPAATRVAGFNAWRKDFKREVQRGEKGIKIIAPAPFKAKKTVDKLDAKGKPVIDPHGKPVKEEKEVTVPAFTVATVFDVSQTDGEPLPQLGVSELTGSVDQYKEFFAAVEKVSPVPVGFEKIPTGAKGYFRIKENRIAINEGMSDLQNLKTLIHEVAHARIHDIDKNAPKDEPRPDRRTREVEAESIAYTVCQHYGIDTSDYSFGYIAGWSGDKQLDTLKSSLDTIRKEADAIITEVDKHLAELTQDKAQTVEQTADHQSNDANTQHSQQDEPKGSPHWQQYISLSNQNPDAIVFIKMGSFYEVMGENANTLANEPGLGFALSGRDVGLRERVPIIGVTDYNITAVANELIKRDYKVAIAENIMDKEKITVQILQGETPLPKPVLPVNLNVVAAYTKMLYDTVQAVEPGSQMSTEIYDTVIRRLEQSNERIPGEHPQLKSLLSHAAQSPDFSTLKERMETLKTDFIQHYPTAAQNTKDINGKAEPTAAAPSTGQTAPIAPPKAPAYGGNVAAIEAQVKAGAAINIADLSDAIKKDKQSAQPTQPRQSGNPATGKTTRTRASSRNKTTEKPTQQKQPSIKEKIAAGKKQLAGDNPAPVKMVGKNKTNELGA